MRKLGFFLLIGALLAGVVLLPLVAMARSEAAQASSTPVCNGAPPPRLSIGAVARPAQVYSTLWKAPDSAVILNVMYKANNDTFTVTAGPRCYGGFNWYQVTFKGVSGWVTEGSGTTYWVEAATSQPGPQVLPTAAPGVPTATPIPTVAPTQPPQILPTVVMTSVGACPGAPAPRLTVGATGRPAQVYSSLRAALESDKVLAVLFKANGDTFKVIAGPFCGVSPHNWYQVDYKGQVGWVTEGQGSTYWIEPVK